VSGPARRVAPAPAPAQRPLVVVGAEWLRATLDSLASRRLLDRLVVSKLWIGVIAFALIGIVTLQLLLLELNTGIGRALQRTDVLQRENAALGIANSELAAGARVQSQAFSAGMEAAAPSALRFLQTDPSSDVPRAAGTLNTPVKPPESQTPASGGETTGAEAAATHGNEAATGATETSTKGSEAGPTESGETSPSGSGEATAAAAGAPASEGSTGAGPSG
jgi:hypothetical protein